jgi:inosine-uridine nucleoside N-ribohydrolase
MKSYSLVALILFSLLLSSCQPAPQTPSPLSSEIQPSATKVLPTIAVTKFAPAPTAETSADVLNAIFTDDGNPDGTTAFLYLLADPGAWIKALVISHGETHPKTYIQHMGRMLDDFGITDIPLGQGQDQAIIPGENFPESIRQLADDFWGFPIPNAGKTYPVSTGAELIVDTLTRSDEPLAVFASGAYTDLALALRLDPSIREKISAIYLMGGAVYVPGNLTDFSSSLDNVSAEWNVYIDPLAASEVFQSGVPIVLVPLDATNQVRITQRDTAAWRAGGRVSVFAADMYDWLFGLNAKSEMAVWDVMTAAIMVHPELCPTVPLQLEVVTEPGNTYGQTKVIEGGEPNVQVCLKPDVAGIRRNLDEVFAAGN